MSMQQWGFHLCSILASISPIFTIISPMANNNNIIYSGTSKSTSRTIVKYKECLHNHAAKIMGFVLDGCGEFEPSGEEGTPQSKICAACFCHRNFHKRVELSLHLAPPHEHPIIRDLPAHEARKQFGVSLKKLATTSRSCCREIKRPRMKTTAEQKEKLTAFAEKRGWKLLKHEEQHEDVKRFCSEIGITVLNLRNWISNNKRKIFRTQALIRAN